MKKLIFLLTTVLITTISFGQSVDFKDSSNDTLITINDEGLNKSSITIQNSASAPGILTDKLYNVGHSLYWNGSILGTGGSSIWSLNGSDAYYNAGKVGIGTITPFSTLSVGGNGLAGSAISGMTTDDYGAGIYGEATGTFAIGVLGKATNTTENAHYGGFFEAAGINGIGVYGKALDGWAGYFIGKSHFDGHVGIGTSTPTRPLTVYDPAVSYAAFQYSGSGNGIQDGTVVGAEPSGGYLWNYEDAPLSFGTKNERRMTIAADGNVGIGSDTPTMPLTVYHADTAWAAFQTSLTGKSSYDGLLIGHTGQNAYVRNLENNPLYFSTNDEIRMSIAADGNVGIGTVTPLANLNVYGSVLFTGLYDSAIPIEGEGRRMMWYPGEDAFRVGYVDGTQWNEVNIGSHSIATGVNTTASGYASTAMGRNTKAIDWHSTAFGYSTEANGNTSTSMGFETVASGIYSTSIGLRTKSDSYASMAVGMYNVGGGNPTQYEIGDPLFEIGNGIGSSISNRHNAVTVLKNGNVGVGTASPAHNLEIFGIDSRLIVHNSGNSRGGIQALGSPSKGIALMTTASVDDLLFGYSDNTPTSADFVTRMYVDNSTGHVGIGTDLPNAQLEISAGDATSAIIVSNDGGSDRFALNPNSDGSWTMFDHALGYWAAGITQQNANVGIRTTTPSKTLYVNGSAGGTQAWNASDLRYKRNISTVTHSLERIMKLRGVEYEWKNPSEDESTGFDNKVHYGVIAQEVEEVFPDLIDNQGNTEEMKHVEYNGFIAILIEAAKEQQKMIEDLQKEVEMLKMQVNQ
jgi:hypothetical protein